jgi:hypothetical protein
MMARLPFFRLPTARLHAFDHSAIDVAGPYNVIKYKMEGDGVDNKLPGKMLGASDTLRNGRRRPFGNDRQD